MSNYSQSFVPLKVGKYSFIVTRQKTGYSSSALNENSIVYLRHVKLRRTLLSLVLLLSYSIGFAHNLVPHCSNQDQFSHSHHQLHNHHGEEAATDLVHEHIAHDNHEDEGLYDFLLCLLSEADHHNHFELNEDFTLSKFSELKFNFLKVNVKTVLSEEQKQSVFSSFIAISQDYFQRKYSIPLIGHYCLRGPPQLS